MGNAMFNCVLQPSSTVRVMRTDGEVLEFDLGHPVIAKQLMKAYPGHLVVHCSQVSRNSDNMGQRSKVSMMRAEDVLLPGQLYCLLRVPTQAGVGKLLLSKLGQTQSQIEQQQAGKNPSDKTNNNENTMTRRKKKRGPKKVVTLRGMFGPGADIRVSDGDVSQLSLRAQHEAQQQLQQQASYSGPWRPQLDAILESPLNAYAPSRAHSVTMSPLARQAGYVPASSLPPAPSSLSTARVYA